LFSKNTILIWNARAATVGQDARVDGQDVRHGHKGHRGTSQLGRKIGPAFVHFKELGNTSATEPVIELLNRTHGFCGT
jgi:hypothetical protein